MHQDVERRSESFGRQEPVERLGSKWVCGSGCLGLDDRLGVRWAASWAWAAVDTAMRKRSMLLLKQTDWFSSVRTVSVAKHVWRGATARSVTDT